MEQCKCQRLRFHLNLLKLFSLCWVVQPAWGQVVPDTTLGLETSVIDVFVTQPERQVVSGGAVRDGLLFHRFEQLNVGEILWCAMRDSCGSNRGDRSP